MHKIVFLLIFKKRNKIVLSCLNIVPHGLRQNSHPVSSDPCLVATSRSLSVPLCLYQQHLSVILALPW